MSHAVNNKSKSALQTKVNCHAQRADCELQRASVKQLLTSTFQHSGAPSTIIAEQLTGPLNTAILGHPGQAREGALLLALLHKHHNHIHLCSNALCEHLRSHGKSAGCERVRTVAEVALATHMQCSSRQQVDQDSGSSLPLRYERTPGGHSTVIDRVNIAQQLSKSAQGFIPPQT